MEDVVPEARVTLGTVHERNVASFKLLLDSILPVTYQSSFFKALVKTPKEFTKMAYYNDILVGSIGCRVEARPDGKDDLYIMTLTVLAPYRRRGIGRKLVENVLENLPSYPNIARVYLHVHTSNTDALEFYKKFGFGVTETVPDYYKRLDVKDAFVVERLVTGGEE